MGFSSHALTEWLQSLGTAFSSSSIYKGGYAAGNEIRDRAGKSLGEPIPHHHVSSVAKSWLHLRRPDFWEERTRWQPKFTLTVRSATKTQMWNLQAVPLASKGISQLHKTLDTYEGLAADFSTMWNVPKCSYPQRSWQMLIGSLCFGLCHTHYVRKQRLGLLPASCLGTEGQSRVCRRQHSSRALTVTAQEGPWEVAAVCLGLMFLGQGSLPMFHQNQGLEGYFEALKYFVSFFLRLK